MQYNLIDIPSKKSFDGQARSWYTNKAKPMTLKFARHLLRFYRKQGWWKQVKIEEIK